MTEEEIRKLAEEHWRWMRSILLQQMEVQHKLFVDAFEHGAKHERKRFIDALVYGANYEVKKTKPIKRTTV